jgi:hypothetical protein
MLYALEAPTRGGETLFRPGPPPGRLVSQPVHFVVKQSERGAG